MRYRTEDYLDRLTDAGFTDIEPRDFPGDTDLAESVPEASRLIGTNVLLALRARRP
ncbi:MAG: hypothetical protein ACRDTE_16895 [Pseudonocardiaceae bacterium]